MNRKYRKLLVVVGFCLAIAGFLAFVFRSSVEEIGARYLVEADQAQKSDLIYVLGGNYLTRAPLAASLFKQGWAPKVLVSREPQMLDTSTKTRENFTDITIRILVANGVPRDRIIDFLPGTGVKSTADEARALRLYLNAYPASRILVVTSSFHARRARMALSRAVAQGTQLRVVTVDDPDCPPAHWRKTEYCQNQVQREWVKLMFYFCTFFG
jgi:uncharacterized SAM-binding protein YcdF (DUF218 family)